MIRMQRSAKVALGVLLFFCGSCTVLGFNAAAEADAPQLTPLALMAGVFLGWHLALVPDLSERARKIRVRVIVGTVYAGVGLYVLGGIVTYTVPPPEGGRFNDTFNRFPDYFEPLFIAGLVFFWAACIGMVLRRHRRPVQAGGDPDPPARASRRRSSRRRRRGR